MIWFVLGLLTFPVLMLVGLIVTVIRIRARLRAQPLEGDINVEV